MGLRERYTRAREQAARVSRIVSVAGRELGPLPPVGDPCLRSRCAQDLLAFCEEYVAHRFPLRWADDHVAMLRRMQDVIMHGGLQAIASPRGDGKTTRAEAAALWALLYGHRRFVVLLAAERSLARLLLRSLLADLETNDLLARDFPEVCIPVRALSGIRARGPGQLYLGQPTRIRVGPDEFVFPTIAGSVSSGATLWCRSIGSAIRGVKGRGPGGEVVRPDLVLVDDMQTDESAASPQQCTNRLSWLLGTVRGLSGPGRPLAAFVNCTVLRPGDAADQLLDAQRYPQWRGVRQKLLVSLPDNMALWDEYWRLRSDALRQGQPPAAARSFYESHRSEMDAGAKASWPERRGDCLSAIEYAMCLLFEDARAFWSEYQNEPLRERIRTPELVVEVSSLAKRTSSFPRYRLPVEAQAVTAFIDVQRAALFYVVVGWTQQNGGYVCDYGVWPPVDATYFSLGDLSPRRFQQACPGRSWDAALGELLDQLAGRIVRQPYERADGTELRLARLCVDAGWGESTAAVRRWCRQSVHAPLLLPSHGRGYGVGQRPLSTYRREPGAISGEEWRITSAQHAGQRQLIFDANYWKTRVARQLACSIHEPDAIVLFAGQEHRMFAEHCCAEIPEVVTHEGSGRRIVLWRQRRTHPDNHYWDCLVGAAVAASLLGLQPREQSVPRSRVRYLS